MTSLCNFTASTVIDITGHLKDRGLTKNKIKRKLMQIPLVNKFGKYIYNHINRSGSDGSSQLAKDKRMWPECKIPDFKPETLDLKQGEMVQIRPKEEIFATLDENGKYKGLLFMREMAKFCGQRHRVFKVVKKIQLESTLEMREIKSPTVFLEGVFCDGEFHDQCDRSCFLYWKEVWLTRVN